MDEINELNVNRVNNVLSLNVSRSTSVNELDVHNKLNLGVYNVQLQN